MTTTLEVTPTAITSYPNQYYTVTSTQTGSSTTATSTEYIYSGTTLLATLDQLFINGTASGTPIERYVHTDNLGSTNVTSDTNEHPAQWLTYYPYGGVQVNQNIASTSAARQYIGQYSDTSGLSYLNARYYNPSQGQFLSQDPVFLGQTGQQNLQNPQSLNAYSYSEDNPVSNSDPTGWYTQQQNTAIANVAAAFGITNFSFGQSSAIGSLASSFGVASPLITNLTGVSASSLGGSSGGSMQSMSQFLNDTPTANTNSTNNFQGYGSALAEVAGTAGLSSDNSGFASLEKLLSHFEDHGADFGAQTPQEYGQMAQDFLQKGLTSNNNSTQFKYDSNDGTMRVYDPSSNTFGSYNTETGETRTLFQPTNGANYWDAQPGVDVSSDEAAELFTVLLDLL